MNLFDLSMLITIAVSCFLWIHVYPFLPKIKAFFGKKSLKPFDCETCLPFWVAVIFVILTPAHWYIIPLAPFLTIIITKLMFRI